MDDISHTERRLLGVLAFLVSVIPILAIATVLVVGLVSPSRTDAVFAAAMVTFIVSAGLQFPAFFMVAAAAGERVPEAERWLFRTPFRFPFGVFILWWRYVRKPAAPPN